MPEAAHELRRTLEGRPPDPGGMFALQCQTLADTVVLLLAHTPPRDAAAQEPLPADALLLTAVANAAQMLRVLIHRDACSQALPAMQLERLGALYAPKLAIAKVAAARLEGLPRDCEWPGVSRDSDNDFTLDFREVAIAPSQAELRASAEGSGAAGDRRRAFYYRADGSEQFLRWQVCSLLLLYLPLRRDNLRRNVCANRSLCRVFSSRHAYLSVQRHQRRHHVS